MLNVEKADIVRLSDEATLTDYYEATGDIAKHVSFSVGDIKEVYTEFGGPVYQIIELNPLIDCDELKGLAIYTKSIDGETDYGIYGKIPLPVGNRKDMADNHETQWIFEPPSNEKWDYDELVFSKKLLFEEDDSDDIYEFCELTPQIYGVDQEEYFILLKEYECNIDYNDPRVIILETGGEDNEFGGLIEIFRGSLVNKTDLEVL